MNRTGYIIAGMALLVISYLLYRDYRREEQVARLLDEPKQTGERHPSDPYIDQQVKNRIIKGYGDLQKCYKDYIAVAPSVTDGEVKMDWQIDEDGQPTRPEVVVSPFPDSLHRCMADTIEKWEFPPPARPRYVVHTFRFNKKK